MRKGVLLVPAELLRDESIHPAGDEDLREPGRVAEHVGDPHLGTTTTELLFEVALPEDDLPHEALPGRQVHVGFHPHTPDRFPLTPFDALGDLREQLGVALLDPGVVLRRRRGEHVLGVVVHERHGRCERADALALGLTDRPQPRRVDVRVTDGDATVPDGVAEVLVHRRSDDAARRADVGNPIQRVGEHTQQAGTSGIVEGQRTHHAVEYFDVVGERFGVGIDHHQ